MSTTIVGVSITQPTEDPGISPNGNFVMGGQITPSGGGPWTESGDMYFQWDQGTDTWTDLASTGALNIAAQTNPIEGLQDANEHTITVYNDGTTGTFYIRVKLIEGDLTEHLSSEIPVVISEGQGNVYNESVSEGVNLSAANGGNTALGLSREESYSVKAEEKLRALFGRALSETFELRDQRKGNFVYNLSRMESLSLSDVVASVAATVQDIVLSYYEEGGQIYNESVTEALTLAVLQGAGFVYGVRVDESFQTGATERPRLTYNLNRNEFMEIIDQITGRLKYGFKMAEALSASDQPTGRFAFHAPVDEIVSMKQEEAGQFEFGLEVGESLTLAEAIAGAFLFNLKLSEIATLRDSIVAQVSGEGNVFNEALTEGLSIGETVAAILTFYAKVREDVRLADTLKGIIKTHLDVQERISLIDALSSTTAGKTFNESLSEKLELRETAIGVFVHALALAEVISVKEDTEARMVFNIQVEESTQIGDALAAIFKFGLMVTENLEVGTVEVATTIRPTITISRGKTYIFTVDVADATPGMGKKKGVAQIKKYH